MSVVIRLMRAGAKKRPFYRMVAADSRRQRDGRFLEILGHYNPISQPFELVVHKDKVDGLDRQGRPALGAGGFAAALAQHFDWRRDGPPRPTGAAAEGRRAEGVRRRKSPRKRKHAVQAHAVTPRQGSRAARPARPRAHKVAAKAARPRRDRRRAACSRARCWCCSLRWRSRVRAAKRSAGGGRGGRGDARRRADRGRQRGVPAGRLPAGGAALRGGGGAPAGRSGRVLRARHGALQARSRRGRARRLRTGARTGHTVSSSSEPAQARARRPLHRGPRAPPMLDLKFLRQNRDKVEAGLALKGMAVDLMRFYAIEDRRLAVLHETEQLRAERNSASEDIAAEEEGGRGRGCRDRAHARGRRSHQGARRGTEDARAGERGARGLDPEPAARLGAAGTRRRAESAGAQLGREAELRLRAAPALGDRHLARPAGFRSRRQDRGLGIPAVHRHGRAARARADPVHARFSHRAARLHRGVAAACGAPRRAVRHRAAAEARERHVPDRRGRAVPESHRRGAGHEHLPRRDPGRRRAAAST